MYKKFAYVKKLYILLYIVRFDNEKKNRDNIIRYLYLIVILYIYHSLRGNTMMF
jgi:hypothetical protein